MTQTGLTIDCFSGAYHGTGFTPPMGDTLVFRRVSTSSLRTSALWSPWVADLKAFRQAPPCRNANAVMYSGSFTFYGGGKFIACSQERPYLVYGFFRLTHSHSTNDGGTLAKLTEGVFLGTADWDNVVSFVFSDAHHKQFGAPEVVLGPSPTG